jgi:hypothetical protein
VRSRILFCEFNAETRASEGEKFRHLHLRGFLPRFFLKRIRIKEIQFAFFPDRVN